MLGSFLALQCWQVSVLSPAKWAKPSRQDAMGMWGYPTEASQNFAKLSNHQSTIIQGQANGQKQRSGPQLCSATEVRTGLLFRWQLVVRDVSSRICRGSPPCDSLLIL